MDLKFVGETNGPDLKLFKTVFREYIKPSTNEMSEVIILNSNDSANVVALTPDHHVVCIRQFRFGISQETLELPGGMVEDGESFEQTARRELSEETGYGSKQWIYLGKIPANPVFQNSFIHHFLALEALEVTSPNLDPAEAIDVQLLPLQSFLDIHKSKEITHPHTLSAMVIARESLLQIRNR